MVGCQGFQLVAMLTGLQEGCLPSMQWECLPFRPSTLGLSWGSEQHPVTVQTQAQALANTSSFAGINMHNPGHCKKAISLYGCVSYQETRNQWRLPVFHYSVIEHSLGLGVSLSWATCHLLLLLLLL